MPTRVILVDDHDLFRQGVSLLLGREPDLEVVGQANSAAAARPLLASVPHDVVVLDVDMPGETGFDLLPALQNNGHTAPVLVLTMFARSDYVREAFSSGALGYALKHQPPDEIAEAVRTVAGGRRYVSPMLEAPANGRDKRGVLETLSSRERDVFTAIVGGLSNAECAERLGISIKTVETHRGHLFRKLGVHSLAELVQLASRHQALDGVPPRHSRA